MAPSGHGEPVAIRTTVVWRFGAFRVCAAQRLSTSQLTCALSPDVSCGLARVMDKQLLAFSGERSA